jgi:hypothetical protein
MEFEVRRMIILFVELLLERGEQGVVGIENDSPESIVSGVTTWVLNCFFTGVENSMRERQIFVSEIKY